MPSTKKWSEIRLKPTRDPAEAEQRRRELDAYAEHWRELHSWVRAAHQNATRQAANASGVPPDQAVQVIAEYLRSLHLELDEFSIPQLIISDGGGECRYDFADLEDQPKGE